MVRSAMLTGSGRLRLMKEKGPRFRWIRGPEVQLGERGLKQLVVGGVEVVWSQLCAIWDQGELAPASARWFLSPLREARRSTPVSRNRSRAPVRAQAHLDPSCL